MKKCHTPCPTTIHFALSLLESTRPAYRKALEIFHSKGEGFYTLHEHKVFLTFMRVFDDVSNHLAKLAGMDSDSITYLSVRKITILMWWSCNGNVADFIIPRDYVYEDLKRFSRFEDSDRGVAYEGI